MFEKVLVANRGEIAIRVMRAATELDVESVAVYSDADKHAGHVRHADEAYNVGPARAAESYLDQEAILDVAARAGADAIHPGYGFLAENAEFAARVEAADDVTWIGPPSAAMERLGGKTSARQVMEDAGVPVVPGTTEPVESVEKVRALGDDYGYPIAIKAEGGGGGRGMRVVRGSDEVDEGFEAARREGEAYFGDPSVYVEKYLEAPRHIEVQILADGHGNVRHLGERDCSLQRRHQKIVEEAPSPALDDGLRERMGAAARQGIESTGYTNAGTVEFLLSDGEFYFMEVNTRIQVEHTVTEAITGIDLVKWQHRIAAGEELDFTQDDVVLSGHAIEYRINAENPAEDFTPTPGTLTTYDPPGGIGIRLDDGVRQGDTVSGDYDSMIGKLIVHAGSREECLARSRRAFAEFEVEGIHTTIPFHRLMLTDAAFVEWTHDTDYLDEAIGTERLVDAVERWGPDRVARAEEEPAVERTFTVEVDGKRFEVDVEDHDPPASAASDAKPVSGGGKRSTPSRSKEDRDGGSDISTPEIAGEGQVVNAEMQGTILDVGVEVGDVVDSGDVLCVLEAMKMENDVIASRGGTVAQVYIEPEQSVDMGDPLVVLE